MTGGDPRYPKELLEVFGQGTVAKLDNFARSEIWRGGKAKAQRSVGSIDKGQRNELASFLDAVKTGGPMPMGSASRQAGSPDDVSLVSAARKDLNGLGPRRPPRRTIP